MSFGILNIWMLAGLGTLVIPPLIHLLNRRRYDVVDWGAMQFLEFSQTARRRLLIEEIILMLLRMGMIAVLVLALASPYAFSPLLAEVGGRPNRDIVLIIDGSYSMGLTDAQGRTPHDAAKEWAEAFLKDLTPGDSVAVLHAKQQIVPVVGELTHDLALVRDKIATLPPPRGGCDWPAALHEAHRILAAHAKQPEREIVVLGDGQRQGWADPDTLFRWEMLATQLRSEAAQAEAAGGPLQNPRIWAVNVRPDRQADSSPPNYALAPIQATRAVAWAGQRLKFKTALTVTGPQEYEPPHRLRLEVDGKLVGEVPAPAKAPLATIQVPLTFMHRFATPGSHVLSVIVEPDPPAGKRPTDYRVKDRLPGDNRQDVAVEVVDALPVLLVDGDARLTPESSTYFLGKALAQAPDPTRPPVVLARAVPVRDFEPELLTRDVVPSKPGSRPRVLVLADVPRLTAGQREAVERFLADGGGVLVVLGDRIEGETGFYNEHLYRGGRGWLPARLNQVMGKRQRLEFAAAPDLTRFQHPALELFREEPNCTLGKARFPRWWKVTTIARNQALTGALLTTGDPLLVEMPYKSGRVLLLTVPLDRSWDANLPSVWEYPVLVHELIYYLADARSVEHNLKPGQPLRYRPERTMGEERSRDEQPILKLHQPQGEAIPLKVKGWPLIYEAARDTGVYRLELAEGRSVYYVVQPDPRESDLTPTNEEDRKKVATHVPMHYENERKPIRRAMVAASQTQELWWWLLSSVVLLLCGEVWLTRRMASARQAW
jgi:hypothetical protein